MDSIKQQKLHALTKFKRRRYPVLKGAFQIFLSISLFSLFFLSYTSSRPPTTNFPKSFKPLLTSFISSYLSLEANRNLMFLLCNAILVFVTGFFGCFRVSSKAAEDIQDEYLAKSAAHPPLVPVEDKEVIVDRIVLVKNRATDIEEEEAAIACADQENHYHQSHLNQPYHHRRGRHSRPRDHEQKHHQRYCCRRHQKQQQYPQLELPIQKEEDQNEKEKYRLQQQKQEERGVLVVIEESDERFDNFIKQVRERMITEAKQLLLTA